MIGSATASSWMGKLSKFLFASALAGVGFKIKFKDVFSKGANRSLWAELPGCA